MRIAASSPVRNTLAEALATPGRVIYSAEPPSSTRHPDRLFRFAEAARASDVVLTLTDSPGGGTAAPPDTLAPEMARLLGRQPIVTVACRGATTGQIQARLAALHDAGLRNVLVVTGDAPRTGRPRFPTDSVIALMAARAAGSTAIGASREPVAPVGALMAAGATSGPAGGNPAGGDPRYADLWLGAAVAPYKYTEGDVWGQRLKAWKKWRAGASFFITQIGYDVAKVQELLRWLGDDGMAGVPVLATVHLLHAGNVSALTGGRLPGVYLSPDLAALVTGDTAASVTAPGAGGALAPGVGGNATPSPAGPVAPGAGRALARRRAALLADVLVRGAGVRGIHFTGLGSATDLAEIRALIAELGARPWRESYEEYRCPSGSGRPLRFAPEDGFSLYPRGDDGLVQDGPAQAAARSRYRTPPRLLSAVHDVLFTPGRAGARLLARALAAGEERAAGRALTRFEHAVKARTLGCEMCGDCRIQYLQFRCPEPTRGCPKGLLNGPCGGATPDGRCEVDPARPCYWRLVVESALASGTLAQLYGVQPPRDAALRGMSSWRNFLLGNPPQPVDVGCPAWLASHHDGGDRAPAPGPVSFP